MNIWLIAYSVLIVALTVTVVSQTTLQARYPWVLNGLTALLIACSFAQWLTEGAGTWTLALGTLAVALSIVAAVKAYRGTRTPTIP